jgi:hypothetical protein
MDRVGRASLRGRNEKSNGCFLDPDIEHCLLSIEHLLFRNEQ